MSNDAATSRAYAPQIPLLVDRTRPDGIAAQIAGQIRDAIKGGRLAAGTRLPSSRRLSEQLDVSRNTIVRVFDTLVDEGLLEARTASGVFVLAPRVATPPKLALVPDTRNETQNPSPEPRSTARMPRLAAQSSGRLAYDFRPGRPPAALFPTKIWRRLIQTILSRGGAAGLVAGADPAGLPGLRKAIAIHVSATRGMPVDPSQVIVTSGAQEGLSLLARLFAGPDANVLIENPCDQAAAFAYADTGARLVHVPVDEDGLIVERIPAGRFALIHVTPSHQFPTGVTLSPERRRALIDFARRHGALIVEDDRDGDFRYEGAPLAALAGAAPDCVAHLGSFSRTLGPGLRLGYMIVPPHLVEAATAAKALLNGGTSWLEQAALAEFIAAGSFAAHLLRAQAVYKANRDALLEALRRCFGDVVTSGATHGLHLLWHLPPGVPSAPALEGIARKARIGVYSLASAGAHDALSSNLSRRALVLGYTSLNPKQIETGIARLSDAIDDTLDASPAFVDELLLHEPLAPIRALAPRNRRKPALRAAPRLRAESGANVFAERPMQCVHGIYRYPIKGLSAQKLDGVTLEAGRPFPIDRIFALARPGVPVDEHDPKWAKKGLFVMLMLDEGLAKVRTHFDPEMEILRAYSGEREIFAANLATAEGRAACEAFVHRLAPALREAPKLVRSAAGHFMDKPDNVVSLINLATLRALSEQWGYAIDPLRFRANFYVDGLRPWQEFEWIGSDIRMGDAVFRVDRRNGRCSATNVNPATGARDRDIPGALRAAFGHKDLGVYLTVQKGGKVVVGDPIAVPLPEGAAAAPIAAPLAVSGPGRFICRGCYFIYDENKGHAPDGIAPGTPFADIPAQWHCPDCGTDKSAFGRTPKAVANA